MSSPPFPGVKHLAIGEVDLRRDLHTTGGNPQTLDLRWHLVLTSRAAGIEPPIDVLHPPAEAIRKGGVIS